MSPCPSRALKRDTLSLETASIAESQIATSRTGVIYRKRKYQSSASVRSRKKQRIEPTISKNELEGDEIGITMRNKQGECLDALKIQSIKPLQNETQGKTAIKDDVEILDRRPAEVCLPAKETDHVEDLVIEQWYADPYQRQDPEAKSFDAARMLVLHDGLRRRGFTNKHIRDKLTLHIFSCQGTYKSMTSGRSMGRNKSTVDRKQTTPADSNTDGGYQPLENVTERPGNDDGSTEQDVRHDRSEIMPPCVAPSHDGTEGDTTKASNGSQDHSITRTECTTTDNVTTADITRDQAIIRIGRNLRLFNLVYGRNGVRRPNYSDYYLDYLHNPNSLVPRPVSLKSPLRTQGHKPLKECTYEGERVYTEDPTFGITPVPLREQISEADKSMFDEAYRRQQRARYVQSVQENWNFVSSRPFSDGYTERWKDLAEKKGVIVPRAKGARSGAVDPYGIMYACSKRRRRVRAQESDSEGHDVDEY